jgi:lactose/cellobiose-specific phosphotransferase system IIC component
MKNQQTPGQAQEPDDPMRLSPAKLWLFKLTDSFESRHFLRALCRGVVYIIPIIILYSVVQAILNLPSYSFQNALAKPGMNWLAESLRWCASASGSYLSMLLAFSLGWNFGREYRQNTYKSFVLAVTTVEVFVIFTEANSMMMDIRGTFSAVVACIFSSAIFLKLCPPIISYCYFRLRHLTVRIKDTLSVLVTMFFIVICAATFEIVIRNVTGGLTIQQLCDTVSTACFASFRDLPLLGAAVYSLVTQLMWFFSINGNALLYSVNDSFYGQLLNENAFNMMTGLPVEHIVNRGFNQIFVLLGGSGALLGLALAVVIASRSRSSRTLGFLSLPCNCIGVSEIVAYGLPVVCNPILFLPFIALPLANLVIAYMAVYFGFVPPVSAHEAWHYPVFFNAYYGTGSFSGVVLQALLIALDTACYIPFVKLNEQRRRFHHEEQLRNLIIWFKNEEDTKNGQHLIGVPDELSPFVDSLITDLHEDLRAHDGRIYMLYQPQFFKNGTCAGAEALLRWRHEKLGFIYPPLVIAVARAGGFLYELEQFIFTEASLAIANIVRQTGSKRFKISVNVTGDSIESDRLLPIIGEAVAVAKIDPSMLWIEITEQDAIKMSLKTLERFNELRRHGHKLLIDDFGMGHTSIRYLQNTVFDAVKLDGSITQPVTRDQNTQKIIRTVTKMCTGLNLGVIAEFVETKEQRDKLSELGCQLFQGYLYSKPVPMNELSGIIARKSAS